MSRTVEHVADQTVRDVPTQRGQLRKLDAQGCEAPLGGQAGRQGVDIRQASAVDYGRVPGSLERGLGDARAATDRAEADHGGVLVWEQRRGLLSHKQPVRD